MARFKILIKSRKIRKSFIFSLKKIREQRVDTLKNYYIYRVHLRKVGKFISI